MAESIYWYDLETTGIDPVRDRPLQFAGVRTNLELEEIAPPQNIISRPGNDIIPSPQALLVTGIRMSGIAAEGMIEKDFVDQVLAQFNEPQTCVAGFNNLRFDDEFTRQMLYRNFHDPYAREWRGGNSRWDVIDLFRAAYALRPEGFEWPVKESGAPSFRLEDLARANGLAHLDAHDALADVRATIEVTRRLRAAQPRLFDFAFRLRDKKAVLQQLYPLGKSAVVHISSMYPARQGCAAVVLPICQHPTNNNAIICFDLSQVPDRLLEANPDELARLVFTRQDELNEERIALKLVHINKSPIIAPLSTLQPSAAIRLNIDLDQCHQHLENLKHSAGLVEKIQEAFGQNRFEAHDDPDFQLYDGGFFSDTDRRVMTEVTHAEPGELEGFRGRFQDERLDEMLFRYKARNWPLVLSEEERKRWDKFRWHKWQEGAALALVESEIGDLLVEESTDERKQVLDSLEAYIRKLKHSMTGER